VSVLVQQPSAAASVRTRTFPVIEIFGPTIQGEGAEAGLPTHFVRFGGCDFRCSWCDTMYAVDPATVRATALRLSADEILDRLGELSQGPRWVTLSGGNPALQHAQTLIDRLRGTGYRVAAETQGSVWRDWLAQLDRLTISPKPPSSGMATARHAQKFEQFMEAATAARASSVLKIVCFDEHDLAWAREVSGAYPDVPLYLSAGTPVPAPADIRHAVGERYRWLCEQVASDATLADARVLPQLHVIAWKEATGV
jgi:7-carboxy-7-deazaguanine synthase